jgi:hypothetical protein
VCPNDRSGPPSFAAPLLFCLGRGLCDESA